MSENTIKKKNEKESRFIIRAYQESCAELNIDSFAYGAPNISLGIGLYDLLLSSRTYLSEFDQVYFVFFPKANMLPNPKIVSEWLVKQEVANLEGEFISPKIFRYTGVYRDVPMRFDVTIA